MVASVQVRPTEVRLPVSRPQDPIADASSAVFAAGMAAADRACAVEPGDVVAVGPAAVLLLKGVPGPAEACGGAAFSGADGEAAAKAMEALGYGPHELAWVFLRTDSSRRVERLRLEVETIDPAVVVCLDRKASEAFSASIGESLAAPGAHDTSVGRRVVVLEGFESLLDDPAEKRAAWRTLKLARPHGSVY